MFLNSAIAVLALAAFTTAQSITSATATNTMTDPALPTTTFVTGNIAEATAAVDAALKAAPTCLTSLGRRGEPPCIPIPTTTSGYYHVCDRLHHHGDDIVSCADIVCPGEDIHGIFITNQSGVLNACDVILAGTATATSPAATPTSSAAVSTAVATTAAVAASTTSKSGASKVSSAGLTFLAAVVPLLL